MRDNQKLGDFISTYLRIFEGTNDLDSQEAAVKMTAGVSLSQTPGVAHCIRKSNSIIAPSKEDTVSTNRR